MHYPYQLIKFQDLILSMEYGYINLYELKNKIKVSSAFLETRSVDGRILRGKASRQYNNCCIKLISGRLG